MQSATLLTLRPGAAIAATLAAAVARGAGWLRRVCHESLLDDDERYVRAATDLADLERRQRRLERGSGDRFAPFGRPV